MVKRFLFLPVAAALLHTGAAAQLHVGGTTDMFVKAGTTLTTDSLVLVPSADLTLEDVTIQGNNTVVNGLYGGASIVQVSVMSAPISFAGTVGLYYDDAQLNGNLASTLELAYDSGGYWITTTGTTVNTANHYLSQTFSTPINIASVTATSPGITLPVDLLGFDAQAEGRRARLEWEVAGASDVTSFDLQRSSDGRHFSTLSQLPVVAGRRRYHLYDERPIAGSNYYRLRLLQPGGKEQLSATRSVVFGSNEGLTLYPVPAHDVLYVALAGEADADGMFTLAGTDGKVLQYIPCTQRKSSIDLSTYQPGIYLLTYSGGGRIHRYKVEKR